MKDEESEVTINFNEKDYVPWNLGRLDDVFMGWYENTMDILTWVLVRILMLVLVLKVNDTGIAANTVVVLGVCW